MQLQAIHRNLLLDSLEKSPSIAERILTSITNDTIFMKRDGGDGWTISEVVGHLADYDPILLERTRLTIETDNPLLPAPDQDDLVRENGYVNQSAIDVFNLWQEKRALHLELLKSLPIDDNALWARPAQHPHRGAFTLDSLLVLYAWHDTNHIHQIVDIINR